MAEEDVLHEAAGAAGADASIMDLPVHVHAVVLLKLLVDDISWHWRLRCVSKAYASIMAQALGELHVLSTTGNGKSLRCRTLVKPPPRTGGVVTCREPLQGLVAQLPALRRAHLQHAFPTVTDSVVEQLAASCSVLQELRLDFCQQVTGTGLQAAAAQGAFQHLKVLSLYACGIILDASFLQLLPSLEELDLSQTNGVAVVQVQAVVLQLKLLSVAGCDWATDELLLTEQPPLKLERLCISRTPITDAGLGALHQCQQLRQLLVSRQSSNLWMDGRWTDDGLQALRQALPLLVIRHET